MNILPKAKKQLVMRCLVDGTSVRATERITGVHRDTIIRLMVRMGKGCAILLDEAMRGLTCKRLQVDEIWSFVHKKQKTVAPEHPQEHGNTWGFVALDADTKLVPAYAVGKRSINLAIEFMKDLESRLTGRVQLSTDALKAYLDATDQAFGGEVDYAQIVKSTETDEAKVTIDPKPEKFEIGKTVIHGNPDPRHISTSLIERQNLTMRMCMRRFTRRTNGFSKKLENHKAAVALHFAYYNFTRIHQSLNTTPAAAAGVLAESWPFPKLLEEAERANERG